jgi:hypothetical protein
VVYLKGKGYAHREIADVVRVDEDTVTEYVRKYRDGGLPGLLAEHYRKGEGQLDAHAERLKKVFENSPPHTVNQVLELLTGKRAADPPVKPPRGGATSRFSTGGRDGQGRRTGSALARAC